MNDSISAATDTLAVSDGGFSFGFWAFVALAIIALTVAVIAYRKTRVVVEPPRDGTGGGVASAPGRPRVPREPGERT
jgi:hypothetical protein